MGVKTRGRKAKNQTIRFHVDFLNLICRTVGRAFVVVKFMVYIVYLIVMYLFTLIPGLVLSMVECRCSFLTTLAISFVYLLVLIYSFATFVGISFALIDIVAISVISIFIVVCIWTEIPQEVLLTYAGIENNNHQTAEKPVYRIDTTQRHYPRKRHPQYIYFTSKPLYKVEIDKDVPDVEEVPGNHCICSFVMKLQPPDPIHSFVVYFCECREDDAFYELCSAFDVPESIRVKIATNSSSMIIRCFDVLHRVYHRDNVLTLDTIKTKLSEYSDELQQIVSDYHAD